MFSSWANPLNAKVFFEHNTLGSAMLTYTSPSLEVTYSCSKLLEIKSKQFDKSLGHHSTLNNNVWKNHNRELFIRTDQNKIRMPLPVPAHVGISGHIASITTRQNIRGKFWCHRTEIYTTTFRTALYTFFETFIRPQNSATSRICASSYGYQLNHPLRLLLSGCSSRDEKYVFVIKNDLPPRFLFAPTICSDSITRAKVWLKWFAAFDTVRICLNDRGMHFINEIIYEIRSFTESNNHFILLYSTLVHGTVQVVWRELLSNEIYPQWVQKTWSTLEVHSPLLWSVHNNFKLEKLKWKCSLDVLTVHQKDKPVAAISTTIEGTNVFRCLEPPRFHALVQTASIHQHLYILNATCLCCLVVRCRIKWQRIKWKKYIAIQLQYQWLRSSRFTYCRTEAQAQMFSSISHRQFSRRINVCCRGFTWFTSSNSPWLMT